jgi:hypothetical protein
MEIEASMLASQQEFPLMSDSIRQRQLDRLSPRGRYAKGNGIEATVREVLDAPSPVVKHTPASGARLTGSPDLINKRRKQEYNVVSRGARSGGEHMVDITPDGGSAGREGRQFTVANVGNNGRIYLR